MKTTSLILLIISLSPASAYADWNGAVTFLEGIAGCNGLTPDLSVNPGVNVIAGANGEYRVGDGIFSLQGTELLFKSNEDPDAPAVEVGSFKSIPTCVIDNAGEPATPQWTEIDLDPGVTAQISVVPNPSTDSNLYRLSITLANGSLVTASW